MTENISWKKRIRKLQIVFFILLLISYFSYSYVLEAYNNYTSTKKELEELTVNKINKKQEEVSKLQKKEALLKKLSDPKIEKAFISAYNKCYPKYIELRYIKGKNWNLVKCIDSEILKDIPTNYEHEFKNFSNDEIEKISIVLWVFKNNLNKFDIDQKRFLWALDQKVFANTLEDKVEVLTLWNPIVLDKKLGLYKVNFTFTTNLNYNGFLSILNKFQNNINYTSSDKPSLRLANNLYFNVENMSDFDLTKPDEQQKINIQWAFYFIK